MFIPWIGAYMDSRIFLNLLYSYDGESSSTGFQIRTYRKGVRSAWKTESYRHDLDNDVPENKEFAIMFLNLLLSFALPIIGLGYLIMLISGAIGFHLAFLDSLGYCLVILSSIYLLVVGFMAMESREFLEYHGCEHKLIAVLNSGLEPTEENIRKAPKNLIVCGSSFLSFILTTSAMIGLALLTHNNIFLIMSASGIAALIIGVIAGRFAVFLDRRLSKDLSKKFLCYGFTIPLSIFLTSLITISTVPILFEYLFCVRNPRTSIIKEGLELAMQIQQTK